MKAPVEILLSVVRLGGRLGPADGKLRTLLPADCPPELKDTIRHHKPALLELLRLNFWIVRTDVLNVIVFWAPDEATKEGLVNMGADRGSIYTAAELSLLVKRRVAPSGGF